MDAIAWIAEQRIQEAQARGELDNLPGSGKPLLLEDDSHIPEDVRMAYKILRNAGYVPEEVAERREIQSLLDMLEGAGVADERETLRNMRRLDVLLGRLGSRRASALKDCDDYYAKAVARLRDARTPNRPAFSGERP
jgi:Domain of unknown function (DUF1992).